MIFSSINSKDDFTSYPKAVQRAIKYLKENDCDKYYMYNKRLLFDEQQEKILGQLEDVEKKLSGMELLKE